MQKKPRRTRAEIQQIVREFERSGLSELDFSKRTGIQTQHLRRWVSREKPRDPPQKLVEVEVQKLSSSSSREKSDDPIEVLLENGRRVRVPRDCDPRLLIRFLDALEGKC